MLVEHYERRLDRFAREVIPAKAPPTQLDYRKQPPLLRAVFGEVPPAEITPTHVFEYRNTRALQSVVQANREKRTFIEPLYKPRGSGRHPRPIAVVSASRYRTFRKGLASRPSLRQWDEIVLAYTLQDEKRRRGVAAVDD